MVGARRSASGASSAAPGTTTPPEAAPPTDGAARNTPASSMDDSEASESPPAAPPAPGRRPTKNITADQKKELQEYYVKMKYNSNDRMPLRNVDSGLDAIIDRYGLTRTQASRQFANYKRNLKVVKKLMRKHKKSELKNIFTTFFDDHEICEFVDVVTCDDKDGKADVYSDFFSTEELMLADLFRRKQSILSDIFQSLAALTDSGFAHILLDMTEFYAETAADVFPQRSKSLSKSEQAFLEGRIKKAKAVAKSSDWTALKPADVDAWKWRDGFEFIEELLFISWARRLQIEEDATSPVQISVPDGDLVSKWAREIVYYTGSWLILQVDLAKNIGDKEKKAAFSAFAGVNNLSKEEARKANLPTGLVDRREKKSLKRISEKGNLFVRRIESTYLENLNLSQMLKHPDGGLPAAIQAAILSNEGIISSFNELCMVDEQYIKGLESSSMRRALLEFILLKYTRMRGREFERNIRGLSRSSQVAGSHRTTTRANVTMQTEKSREGKSREADMEARIRNELSNVQLTEDDAGDELNEKDDDDDDDDRNECEMVEQTIVDFPHDAAIGFDDEEDENEEQDPTSTIMDESDDEWISSAVGVDANATCSSS